jgi:hypothetical protein
MNYYVGAFRLCVAVLVVSAGCLHVRMNGARSRRALLNKRIVVTTTGAAIRESGQREPRRKREREREKKKKNKKKKTKMIWLVMCVGGVSL